MAGTKANAAALNVAKAKADGFTLKHCPATCNLACSMDRKTWDNLCKKTRKREMEPTATGHEKRIKSFCSVCMGKIVPRNLTIKNMEKERGKGMAGARVQGICENCGSENIATSKNYGVMMCSTCATIHSHVAVRPQSVKFAIERIGNIGEFLGSSISVPVERAALQQIADAIGYTGGSGGGLLIAINQMVARASEESNTYPQTPPDLLKALGCSTDEVTMAAMQIAAQLEDKERDDSAVQILRLRDILGLPFVHPSALIDQVEQVVGGLEGDSDQGDHLREQLQAIRIALGVTDPAFDVARAIGELAQTLDRYKSTCERLTADAMLHEYPSVTPPSENGKQIESMILDLSLMALRGEVIGLDPAFLSAMREAA